MELQIKRKNAGRKPVSDKKKQVSLYIEQSKIDRMGGLDELKRKIQEYINRSSAKSK